MKSGNATRTAAQLTKDILMESEGADIIGKNAPPELQGQTIPIRTIERKVNVPKQFE